MRFFSFILCLIWAQLSCKHPMCTSYLLVTFLPSDFSYNSHRLIVSSCTGSNSTQHLLASLISRPTLFISISWYQQFVNGLGACACSSCTVNHETCFVTNTSMLPFGTSLDEQLYFSIKMTYTGKFQCAKTLRWPRLSPKKLVRSPCAEARVIAKNFRA